MSADRQRPRAARRLHSLRRHVPHVLRLRAQRAAHGGAHEAAHDLRLHARLDRPRRGRADASVDRARGEPAPHSGHGRLAAVRHGRVRGRVGRGARAPARSVVPAASRARTVRSCRATQPVIDAIARGGYVLADFDANGGRRARGRSSRPAPKSRWRSARAKRSPRKASRCAWCRCRARACSSARTPPIARRCCRAGVPRVAVEAGVTDVLASLRRRRGRSARRRRRHRHASASRRRRRCCSSISASRSSAWPRRACMSKASRCERVARCRHASRLATPADAHAIAQVRVDAWRTTYRGLIPDTYLAAMTVEDSAALVGTRPVGRAQQDQHVRRRERRPRRGLRVGPHARRERSTASMRS